MFFAAILSIAAMEALAAVEGLEKTSLNIGLLPTPILYLIFIS